MTMKTKIIDNNILSYLRIILMRQVFFQVAAKRTLHLTNTVISLATRYDPKIHEGVNKWLLKNTEK